MEGQLVAARSILKEGFCVIQLTKINGEKILVNPIQIEFIESIPESKIVMMNERYHIVSETQQEIMKLSSEFYKGLVEMKMDFEKNAGENNEG